MTKAKNVQENANKRKVKHSAEKRNTTNQELKNLDLEFKLLQAQERNIKAQQRVNNARQRVLNSRKNKYKNSILQRNSYLYGKDLSNFRLIQEARKLEQESPIIRGILQQANSFLVSHSSIVVMPQPKRTDGTIDKELAKVLKSEWQDFCVNPLIDRENVDYVRLSNMIVTSYYRDGEVWLTWLIDGEGKDSKLKLKAYPAEYVPYDGIKYDKYGKPTEYTFRDPAGANEAITLPADQVLHIANTTDFNSTRGVSVIGAAIELTKKYQLYINNEIKKSTINASIIATVSSDGVSEFNFSDGSPPAKFELDETTQILDIPEGKKLSFMSPNTTNANATEFAGLLLRNIATAVGVMYSELANVQESSYSAARMELINAIERYKQVSNVLRSAFVRPLYKAFVKYLVLEKKIKVNPKDYKSLYYAAYISPVRPTIDPVKDATAKMSLMRLGLMSHSEASTSLGLNFEETLGSIKADKEQFDMADLSDLYNIAIGKTGEKGFTPDQEEEVDSGEEEDSSGSEDSAQEQEKQAGEE